jgi:hypothetical protein
MGLQGPRLAVVALGHIESKDPPEEPVALQLLAPQKSLIATVVMQKPQQFAACNDID